MDTTLREAVAEEVRVHLVRQRRSGSWLARETGRTQTWVSTRLTGKVPIDVDDMEVIAAALKLSIGDLLEGVSRRRSTASALGVSTLEDLLDVRQQTRSMDLADVA